MKKLLEYLKAVGDAAEAAPKIWTLIGAIGSAAAPLLSWYLNFGWIGVTLAAVAALTTAAGLLLWWRFRHPGSSRPTTDTGPAAPARPSRTAFDLDEGSHLSAKELDIANHDIGVKARGGSSANIEKGKIR